MREVHGVATTNQNLTRRALVVQGQTSIRLDLVSYSEIDLSVAEARHLARALTRVASRVEATLRKEPTDGPT